MPLKIPNLRKSNKIVGIGRTYVNVSHGELWAGGLRAVNDALRLKPTAEAQKTQRFAGKTKD